MKKIDCLDHGFVRLVDHMGSDLSVVRAARVSYDAAWRAGEDEGSDKKLINYLWKNKHTTPFEAVTFTFEVKAPIFVFRQWHRHRTWSINELSARFRELPEEFYIPAPEQVGVQAVKNKQGRDIVSDQALLVARGEEAALLRRECESSFRTYRHLLKQGWPRELARSVLPVNTYSHMFATVNLLNLLKFATLRTDPHAQYEIRVFADAMMQLAREIVPECVAAWEKSQKTDAVLGTRYCLVEDDDCRSYIIPRDKKEHWDNAWLISDACQLGILPEYAQEIENPARYLTFSDPKVTY